VLHFALERPCAVFTVTAPGQMRGYTALIASEAVTVTASIKRTIRASSVRNWARSMSYKSSG